MSQEARRTHRFAESRVGGTLVLSLLALVLTTLSLELAGLVWAGTEDLFSSDLPQGALSMIVVGGTTSVLLSSWRRSGAGGATPSQRAARVLLGASLCLFPVSIAFGIFVLGH